MPFMGRSFRWAGTGGKAERKRFAASRGSGCRIFTHDAAFLLCGPCPGRGRDAARMADHFFLAAFFAGAAFFAAALAAGFAGAAFLAASLAAGFAGAAFLAAGLAPVIA